MAVTINQVDAAVSKVYRLVRDEIDPQYELPLVNMDLRGRCAGKAYCHKNRIRINMDHPDEDSLYDTVRHEIAHVIDFMQYGNIGHGSTWKEIMIRLGDPKPERCHSLPLPRARKRKLHVYSCDCGVMHKMTTQRHNRQQRSNCYICKSCKSKVKYTGEDVVLT